MFRGDLATPRGRALAWADSLLVDHGLLRLAWTNAATVVPGRLYRCNYPDPRRLSALTRRLGLRTLVNLRGATGNGSDALARQRAAALGLAFLDAPLRSRRAPTREAILHLAGIYAGMAEPALVFCKSGADRAGFAAGLYLLLQGEGSAAALGQLSLRHGHLARSPAGILRAVFLRYARDAEGRLPFLDWVRREYDPEALARDFASGGVAGGLARAVNDRLLRRE
ncbi:tyrosine-protein phosphatase [Roseomonas sp. NAR14]|uniref:Tyrosine-protein phosphatase n=1 Tax=Roseomonas acroporae TaxID=2937791 RepID=A0A9X1YA56_9PROT|nr:tyrosine-protein phosphatase [Roseomonas acroporae]